MNNSKLKITRIVGEVLGPLERKTFRYVLGNNSKQMAGILSTNNTVLSISFCNGSDVEINSLETLRTDPIQLPPFKRILKWEQDLTECRVLTGSIENALSKSQTVSLYLITFNTQNDEK
ncbi:hypothetical protein [Aquimarina sp. 2304DJ70-9]|uniref:hypothetical protein n=1 Tax=Aquimarina penaris TaxID=3231044 RepID=UPI003461F81E